MSDMGDENKIKNEIESSGGPLELINFRIKAMQ